MSLILGLDLGSYSVKAVLLDSSKRDQPVQRYLERIRGQEAEADRDETLRAAVREILEPLGAPVDQTVISLPGQSLATHVMTLPFTDAKRLEAALPFEVESQLPFDLNEAIYDYQPLKREAEKTQLLVSVVRREELRALLALLAPLGVDPRLVTHPGIAYHSLWTGWPQLFAPAEGRCSAVVDLGHERTSVAIREADGALGFARTFAGGGRDLTRAIANDLKIALPEARRIKEERGGLGAAAQEPESQRLEGALVRGFQPILRELRATLKAYVALHHRPVEHVFLCGGTAKLPGLAQQMTRDLAIDSQVLLPPQELGELVGSRQEPAAMQACALALRGERTGPKASRFNLRRGDLAFKGHFDYLRERVVRLSVFAAILIFLFVLLGVVRNSMLGSREAAVDQTLCDLTQKVLGRCEKNYDRALNMMQGKESPTAAIPKYSAVNLLAEMTQRIPSDVPVTFSQIVVAPDRVDVQGTTDSSKQVDRMSQAIKGFHCFREVKVGKLEKTADQHINFRLEVQVDCPEQGGGEGEAG